MKATRALAIIAAIFLLPLTGLVAGRLAYIAWGLHDGRGAIVIPVVFFALIGACLVGCALTRIGLGIFLVLVACGIFVFLLFILALASAN